MNDELLKNLLKAALTGKNKKKLNDWELGFLSDINLKINLGITLTDKQLAKVVDVIQRNKIKPRKLKSKKLKDAEENAAIRATRQSKLARKDSSYRDAMRHMRALKEEAILAQIERG